MINTDPNDPQAHATTTDLDDALQGFGLRMANPDQPGTNEVYLWPENADTWELWTRCQTQWRWGPRWVVGLDYAAVRSCMELLGWPPQNWAEVFGLVQHMEFAALDEWAAQRRRSGA